MFAVIFELEGQLDCTLHATADEAAAEHKRLSEKYATERANYSASVQVQELAPPAPYAAAPAMLAALQVAADALNEAAGRLDLSNCEGEEDEFIKMVNSAFSEATDAIAAATGTPTDGIEGQGATVGISAPMDFNTHAGIITAAQRYISDPEGWNPPSPAQLAHILGLCGISHGPIASEGEV